jgi:tetratricopeptide (TPR) repeat protein
MLRTMAGLGRRSVGGCAAAVLLAVVASSSVSGAASVTPWSFWVAGPEPEIAAQLTAALAARGTLFQASPTLAAAEILIELQAVNVTRDRGPVLEGRIRVLEVADLRASGQAGVTGAPAAAALDLAGRLAADIERNATELERARRTSAPPHVAELNREANRLYQARDLENALTAYDSVLAQAPGYVAARYSRATALLERGQLTRALEDYAEVLRRQPDHKDARRNRLVALSRAGRAAEALPDADLLVTAYPDDAAIRLLRAHVRATLGQDEGALADYDSALKTKPSAEGHLARASLLQQMDRPADALRDLDAVLQLAPRNVAALRERARLRAKGGDAEGALADLDTAIREAREDGSLFRERGLLHLKQRRHADAVADLTAAVLADPKDARAWWGRAQAHDASGQKAQAAVDRKRALALDPSLAAAQR